MVDELAEELDFTEEDVALVTVAVVLEAVEAAEEVVFLVETPEVDGVLVDDPADLDESVVDSLVEAVDPDVAG